VTIVHKVNVLVQSRSVIISPLLALRFSSQGRLDFVIGIWHRLLNAYARKRWLFERMQRTSACAQMIRAYFFSFFEIRGTAYFGAHQLKQRLQSSPLPESGLSHILPYTARLQHHLRRIQQDYWGL
jgi:hypothetical protein